MVTESLGEFLDCDIYLRQSRDFPLKGSEAVGHVPARAAAIL
jgi:hypothetical protein